MTKLTVECCANSLESCINGEKGGAHRIEFCKNLDVGGLTPSYDNILLIRSIIKIPIFILIRPRAGDFIYSEREFKKMLADIEFCKKIGCDGIVIGSLNKNKSINYTQTNEMTNLARPMEVTFHRAFDESLDITNDLETIIKCGCDRLLTSGKGKNVNHGLKNLKTIMNLSKDRIRIIAGSGVNHRNIKQLYQLGINEFHLSGKIKNKNNKTETSEELIRLAVNKTKHIA